MAMDLELIEDGGDIEDSGLHMPGNHRAVLASPRRREMALAALRVIDAFDSRALAYLTACTLERENARHQIMALIGLDRIPARAQRTPGWLRRECENLSQRYEQTLPVSSADLLNRNIDRLADPLRLSPTETAILRLGVLLTGCEGMQYIVKAWRRAAGIDRLQVFTAALRLHRIRIKTAFASASILRCAGFFSFDADKYIDGEDFFEVESVWLKALTRGVIDEAQVLRRLLRIAPPPTLTMADFAHVEQVDTVQSWLRDALARRRRGVNVLLHGAPGTGKTQFARACATALDAKLYEVPNEDREGDPISGQNRFSAYSVCQRMLAQGRRQMLLFDEVEDVFGSRDGQAAMFAGSRLDDAERLRKSWVNEVLESNAAPTLWACNSIDGLDPAYVRRFDLVVEFKVPGRPIRRKMIDRYFKPGAISERCAERLSSLPALAPAQVERVARVSRALRGRDRAQRDAEVEAIVRSSLRAMGHADALPAPVLPEHYDPAFIHADRDLDALAQGLRARPVARLCLYGAPGTGKTAFAHHLGRVLEKPVLVRRGSDLLSMYVGQTEAQIRAAFAQARADGAILVIDEADGFLRDRAGAHRAWEVTQVNELLTQMESFDGLFIASTNLVDMLDAASLRRFDFKIRFGYLRREQRRAMLARVCGESANEAAMATAVSVIDRLEQLTPGDFTNVLRQLHATGESVEPARVLRLLTAEVAFKPEARHRGIGFTSAQHARAQ